MADFHALFDRYIDGKITTDEFRELLAVIRSGNAEPELKNRIDALLAEGNMPHDWPADLSEIVGRNRNRIRERVKPKPTAQRNGMAGVRRLWLPVAAATLLAVGVSAWLVSGWRKDMHHTDPAAIDIQPGGNRATLTLADGRTIDLSSEQEGIIIQDGITYLDGSEVIDSESAYGMSDANGQESHHPAPEPQQLTLTTPKGGTYQITLPDGSTVWLNAASTLQYPSRFAAHERVVSLHGEAYFSVREAVEGGENIPFHVLTTGQTVEVLGTEFNVSAYAEDGETQTTLVKGRVRVDGTTLQPGQQAVSAGDRVTVRPADLESTLAWKYGYFRFNDEPLSSIARKLSRWYDVDVVCKRGAALRFGGSVSRFSNIAEVLEILELTETVSFRMEDGRLVAE